MYRVVRSVYLDMAHRIRGHAGKCVNVHGHTWKVEVCLSSNELDEQNMVMDFGEVDELLLRPLEEEFDHCWLIGKGDVTDMQNGNLFKELCLVLGSSLKIARLPIEATAETLSKYFYDRFCNALDSEGKRGVDVVYVRVYEKLHPKESYAEYSSNRPEHTCV